jgi:hypothetical protein
MDELKRQLDEEARRVQSDPEALEAVRRRAGRRRMTRQVGTGALALAVAGAGFGVAYSAFRGGPAGRPLVGPSGSISPDTGGSNVLVIGPGALQDEASELSSRLVEADHDVDTAHCPDCAVPDSTILRYTPEARAEAESIRRNFLPGAEAELLTWSVKRGQIRITLGADYNKISASAIQVRILDGSLLNGAADAALTILEGEGYEVVAVQDAGTVYEQTFISCAPQHEAEADLIREALFSKAEIRAELPDEQYDVTVHIGPDFYDDYAGKGTVSIDYNSVVAFLDQFVKARGTLGNARQFMSLEGYIDYTAGTEEQQSGQDAPPLFWDGGITDHRILKFDKVDRDSAVVELWMRFGAIGDCLPFMVVERLRIEPAPPGEGRGGLWVTSATLLGEEELLCPAVGESGG